MIRHIVLTKFKPGTPEETIKRIYAGLSAVTDRLSGARNFAGGRSESPEQIERGYMHGFVVDFDDWAALETYQNNEEHKVFGRQLVENAVGGIDGILVLDLNIEP